MAADDFAAGSGNHGFSAASLVWRYPAADDGSAAPGFALGAFGGDGIVWVADAAGGELTGVATGSAAGAPTAHDVVARYGAGQPGFAGSLSSPCAVSLTGDGALAVADPGASRVSVVGTTADSSVAMSRPLTCGRAGRKLFVSVTCSYLSVPYAPAGVSVRVDDGDWTFLRGQLGGAADGTGAVASGTFPLPRLSVGQRIEYSVSMANTYRSFSPRLLSLSVTYEPRGNGSGSGGGGESGTNARSNGSGSYTYPGSGGGSGQGSGGGVGGGTGSGSGTGSGNGYGSGSSASTMGADVGSSAGSATGAEIPDSVDTTATAPGSDAVVSGYLMKASGFAGGGEGGGASSQQAVTSGRWMFLPAGAGLLCLLLFAAAAVNENRRIRVYADFDPGRPRALPAEFTPTTRPPLPPPIVQPARRR